MSDRKDELLEKIKYEIMSDISNDEMINNITLILNEYDIRERTTELSIVDTYNQKMLSRYAACLLLAGKSEKTITQYMYHLNKMNNTINVNFKDISTYDIRVYLAIEKQRGVSNRTLSNTNAYISAFFKWLVNEDEINKNPCSNIVPIKINKEVKKPFSDIEIDKLKNACVSLRQRALIEFLLSTGVRVNELHMMNIDDVDFNTLSVHVRFAKGGNERIAYISDVAASHLKAYLSTRRDNDEWLFASRRGRMTTRTIGCELNMIANIAHVEHVHPHRFRRTFATKLSSRGVDVQIIQKLLGHSNINTTMTYVCVDSSRVHSAYLQHIS